MKKYLIGILLAITTTFATDYVASNLAATNTVAINAAAVVNKVTLWSTNNSPTLVYLMDGDITTVTAAWTNYTLAVSSVVTTYVGAQGTTNTLTNSVLKQTASPHAAATNTTPAIATIVVPAAPSSGTALITFDEQLIIGKKLTLSNSVAGLNVIINYRNP